MSFGGVYEQITRFRTSIDLAAHTRTTTQQSTQILAQGVRHVHSVKEWCRSMNMERNAGSDTTKGAAALDRVKKLRRIEPSLLPPLAALPLLSAICTGRGPSAWNSPLAALHLHEVRIIHERPLAPGAPSCMLHSTCMPVCTLAASWRHSHRTRVLLYAHFTPPRIAV